MDTSQPTSERWKPVKGYEGIYEVSSHGRVRSVDRTITRSDGQVRRLKGRAMRATLNEHGYPFVDLRNQGKRRVRKVHSLVAEAFIGPRPDSMDVCHNDGNPANNHVDNLRYGTHSENMLDKVRHGTDPDAAKTHCPRDHELFAENLTPSIAKQGRRDCRACARARAYVHYHSHLRDEFKAIADNYFNAILEERKIAA